MREDREWGRAIGIGVLLSLVVGVLVTAFAWPAANSQPRDLPVAVVGPEQVVGQVQQQLAAAAPEAFDVRPAPDPDTAREYIRERDVYGAVVVDPSGPPQILVASAASPAVAQMLGGLGQQMAQQAGAGPAEVEDVVALPADDPRGAGFAAAALPMVMSGLIVGVAMALGVTGVWRRVTGALVASAAAGAMVTLVVQGWLGSLTGDGWANAGAVALTVAAISLTIIGLHALLGHAGIGLGALIVFLLGNPLSGVASAPEMLPAGWGTLGQLLPPGAGGTLLRSTAFFDGAAVSGPILVLTTWVVIGLVLASAGSRSRDGRATPSPAVEAGR